MRVVALITGCLLASCVARAETWYVDASATGWGDGRSWETAFITINRALQAGSYYGDTIIVGEGTYQETIEILGRILRLTSKDPTDPAVVAATIIDANAAGPALTFDGSESERCVVEGFTITNGRAADGGGINGNGTLATIRYNVITRNVACGGPWPNHGSGGGIYRCNGLIENNVISENVAGKEGWPDEQAGNGGAIAYCAGTIRNNTIVRNSVVGKTCNAEFPWNCDYAVGPALFVCNGTIEENLIADNRSESGGGAIWRSWASILRNTLSGNSGAGLVGCGGVAAGNIMVGNAYRGVYGFEGLLLNNTIVANTGGGVRDCRGFIQGCIIWANGGLGTPQLEGSDLPTYSCIEGWTGGGEGNISEEPRFVDAERGDFRFSPDSPCIDAGFNDPQLPETDIAGMHRIMFGGKSLTVDMGAYEFYINDLTPGPTPEQTTFSWSSPADKTYSIFYSSDLLTWHLAVATFPSSGNTTTSWIDDGSKTGLAPSFVPRRFYRTVENPQ